MKQVLKITLSLLFFMNAYILPAQSGEKPLSVGIFVYPGVEILDFTGPSEVFGSTEGFKAFIVAYKKEPIVSQGFITVTPQYSIDDCPPTDILVFPGGGTGSVMGEQKMIDWIRERSATTQFMMSVCTGAGLLSKAGLLDGKEVTTWYGFIPGLQAMTLSATVLSNTRFVDNGHVVTTAGVSAGIDGALHLVSRIKGEATARATARYMEYDKWEPKMGKVNETPFIKTLRSEGLEAAQKKHQPVSGSLQPLYYPGEMINLAMELLETKPAESEAILQCLIKSASPTPALYNVLGTAYKKTGKTAPPDSRTFLDNLAKGETQWAKKTYRETVQMYPDWLLFTEDELNSVGYQLQAAKKTKESIEVFQWNTELYPASANAWDSLAEMYESAGKPELAIAASERCLAKLPGSGYEEGSKETLAKASSERIARLKEKP
ncbi:MAG: DJ-1/PfpI family protein [Lewinellaceae bacterium]|nr:DJ-1/PfpI family protein [Lewinellaceae bacterium]